MLLMMVMTMMMVQVITNIMLRLYMLVIQANLFHIILHQGLDHFRTTVKLSRW